MPITVTYNDNIVVKYDNFDEIINIMNVIKIYCSFHNLKSLPDNMMFPNLTHFVCSYNNLYYIPPHINCYIEKDKKTKTPEYMRRKLLI